LVLRAIAAAPEASLHLIDSGLVPTLLNLLRTQQEDDEFVLQVGLFFCQNDTSFIIILALFFHGRFFMFSIAFYDMMKYASSS
jgi:hypothetical protein